MVRRCHLRESWRRRRDQRLHDYWLLGYSGASHSVLPCSAAPEPSPPPLTVGRRHILVGGWRNLALNSIVTNCSAGKACCPRHIMPRVESKGATLASPAPAGGRRHLRVGEWRTLACRLEVHKLLGLQREQRLHTSLSSGLRNVPPPSTAGWRCRVCEVQRWRCVTDPFDCRRLFGWGARTRAVRSFCRPEKI